jgi:hypothetical protein
MKPFAFFRAASAPASKLSLSLALAGTLIFGPATSFAQTSPPVYPEVGPTTHFVNQDTVLSGFPEPAWYKANVPFYRSSGSNHRKRLLLSLASGA